MVTLITILVGGLCSLHPDTFFFRSGKGLAAISQPDRKLTYYTYFVTNYNTEDEDWLQEDVMMAALEVYDRDVRPSLGQLKLEIVRFRATGDKSIAMMSLYYNNKIEYYKADFQLLDADGNVKDEIEITRDEYNGIAKKCNSGEKFDVVQLFKKMKKEKK